MDAKFVCVLSKYNYCEPTQQSRQSLDFDLNDDLDTLDIVEYILKEPDNNEDASSSGPVNNWQERMERHERMQGTDDLNECFHLMEVNFETEEHLSPRNVSQDGSTSEPLFERLVDVSPVEQEEQKTDNIEEDAFKMTNDTMHTSEIQKVNEEEIDDSATPSTSYSYVEPIHQSIETENQVKLENNIDIKKDKIIQKIYKIGRGQNRDSTKTTPNEPVLQANDPEGLLEQFEAASSSHNEPVENGSACSETAIKPQKKRGRPRKQDTEAKKLNTPILQASDAPSEATLGSIQNENMIDRIKLRKRKKVSPTTSNTEDTKQTKRSRRTRSAFSKHLNKTSEDENINMTNAIDPGRKENILQLDHDYCKSVDNSDIKQKCYISLPKLNQTTTKQYSNNNQKEDNDLPLSKGNSPNILSVSALSNNQRTVSTLPQTANLQKAHQQKKQSSVLHNSSLVNKPDKLTNQASPLRDIENQPAITPKIPKVQQNTPITEQTSQKSGVKYISLLKTSQPSVNLKESIVTTTNSSNQEIENIIIEEIEETANTTPNEAPEEKKPQKIRKMTVEEYRLRKQNRLGTGANSTVTRTVLVHVHHASTTTELQDDPNNGVEREIVTLLKSKTEIEEQQNRPKPSTCDIEVQTYETIFEFPTRHLHPDTIDDAQTTNDNSSINSGNSNERDGNSRREDQRRNRSRSRSTGRRRSRSRSNSSDRCRRNRNRSGRRHDYRERRPGSNSSSSSSMQTSHYRERYQRSRSRTPSRSSSSSQHNFDYSRSSNSSSEERHRRSHRYSSDRERSYDRHESRSYASRSYVRHRTRSPIRYYQQNSIGRENEISDSVEERRIVYVGRINERTTKSDLRNRFSPFGSITDIKLYFRDYGDNYGFVTFARREDAYRAIEQGNNDPSLPRYELCFGGRRTFCQSRYADLDGMTNNWSDRRMPSNDTRSFDSLLEEAIRRQRST